MLVRSTFNVVGRRDPSRWKERPFSLPRWTERRSVSSVFEYEDHVCHEGVVVVWRLGQIERVFSP